MLEYSDWQFGFSRYNPLYDTKKGLFTTTENRRQTLSRNRFVGTPAGWQNNAGAGYGLVR
jgi:hypothetical protein